MRSNLERGSIVVALLLGALLLAGCGGGTSPPIGRSLNYGPPYYEIAFVANSNYIATLPPTPSATPYYLPSVGLAGTIVNPGYAVLWRPSSTLSDPRFIIYDEDQATLDLVDGNGTVTHEYTNGMADKYSFSSGSSRLAYIRPNGDGQDLISEGAESGIQTVLTVNPPFVFGSRPCYKGDSNASILVSVFNSNDPTLSYLTIYSTTGSESQHLDARAIGAAFNPTGDEVAYIDGINGAAQATDLVITDAVLNNNNELGRYPFNGFATGASALAWSPDGTMIAFYAGVFGEATFGQYPHLVLFNLATNVGREITLTDGRNFVTDAADHPLWAYPTWNANSDSLAVCTTSLTDSSKYSIVITDLNGTDTMIADKLNNPTTPAWLGLH